jgi:peroxiredoxin
MYIEMIKKIISVAILVLLIISVRGQNVTKIVGHIPTVDSSISIHLYINNSEVIAERKQSSIQANTIQGDFSFEFMISKPSLIVLMINGKNIFYPGKFHVLIEPNDSLNFYIQDLNNLGIMNILASGKGSEKIEFCKRVFSMTQAINRRNPPYEKQSILSKFKIVDEKLDAIDSVYNIYKDINIEIRDILKAYEYHYAMDLPFIAATRSESDSLSFLFNYYFTQKERMKPLLKDHVVNYFPNHVLENYVLLSAFRNPVKEKGLNFIKYHSLEYANLIKKHFEKNSSIKDYMLAKLTISKLKSEKLSENSKAIYQFYKDNVSTNSRFYKEVTNLYEYIYSNLSVGTPFLQFTLPDSTGKFYRLQDFKGKVLVMDFWFNGCIGCAQITKALDSIHELIPKKDIVMMSVGIDTRKNWLSGIGKFSSINSLNLYTDEQGSEHAIIKFLNFTTYPQLIVIDREGKFAGVPPDPRSMKNEFINFIKSL